MANGGAAGGGGPNGAAAGGDAAASKPLRSEVGGWSTARAGANAGAAGAIARIRGPPRGGGGGGGNGGGNSGASASAGCFARLGHHFRGALAVARRRPGVVVVAALVALLVAGAGTGGVLAASASEIQHRRASAQGTVDAASAAITTRLQQLTAPLLALAAFVHENPDFARLSASFNQVAGDLLEMPESSSTANMQLAPHGVVRAIYPLAGNEAAVGLDLLRDGPNRAAALRAIELNKPTVQGPMKLKQGYWGMIVRLPVFKSGVSANETFNAAPGQANNCSVCYNATTGTKFWGFVTAIINAESIADGSDARLRALENQGYHYELTAPQPGAFGTFRVGTDLSRAAPVTSDVDAPSGQWRLQIAPTRGWAPGWRAPMIVTAIVIGLLFGLLVAAILVNRTQLVWLVDELRATNRELADEKSRMSALLGRQIDLINALERGGGAKSRGGGNGNGGGGNNGGAAAGQAGAGANSGSTVETPDDALSPHSQTLVRIEDMRRHLGAGSQASCARELERLELLGEGSFGKVFRGTWRGGSVAIKTMVLPARMSGAEKRERMLVMEAAISSAMLHPNIVQTYTYTIKPTTDSRGASSGELEPGFSGSIAAAAAGASGSHAQPPQRAHVYNYEVSLVLEYCDKGSLRDALDARAFLLPAPGAGGAAAAAAATTAAATAAAAAAAGGDAAAAATAAAGGGAAAAASYGGLNYKAVLDTAADVARAMLHLHQQQVVHADLKARNILLKSDGGEGRGVVAKVADFGLAVRIDAAGGATHVSEFRGTQTHMAPEAQLAARVSKAGDVYAFGITCWELLTGGHAFDDVPMALLGHRVAVQGARPEMPEGAPADFRRLVEACWAGEPEHRPDFGQVLSELTRMRAALGGRTPPLGDIPPPPGAAWHDSSGGGGIGTGGQPRQRAPLNAQSQQQQDGFAWQQVPPPGGWHQQQWHHGRSSAGGAPRGSWGSMGVLMPAWAPLDAIADAPGDGGGGDGHGHNGAGNGAAGAAGGGTTAGGDGTTLSAEDHALSDALNSGGGGGGGGYAPPPRRGDALDIIGDLESPMPAPPVQQLRRDAPGA